VTTITGLAAAIRPIALHDLRSELGGMQTGEALLIHLDGKAFVVVAADAWSDLVETASGRDDAPMVPDEFDRHKI
jgi:hypothetical protein